MNSLEDSVLVPPSSEVVDFLQRNTFFVSSPPLKLAEEPCGGLHLNVKNLGLFEFVHPELPKSRGSTAQIGNTPSKPRKTGFNVSGGYSLMKTQL